MAKISKFDRPNVKIIHAEINSALSIIAKKYGLSLSTGTLSFSDDKFTVRITGLSVCSKKEDGYSTHPTSLIGNQFMSSNGIKFKIIDYKPSRPKYPIVAENTSGTRYKFTLDAVKRGLIK